jgi:septum formation protein
MSLTPILLASESPRRVEIMGYLKLPFETVAHTFDERTIPWDHQARPYVQKLALAKAQNVANRFPHRTVLAADTIVVVDDQLLTKPSTRAEAANMIRLLAGSWHEVITGVAVISGSTHLVRSDTTRVLMQPLTTEQIDTFLNLNLWNDKAGGYAIQGAGSLLVQRIEGCYYNVIGLPVVPLSQMLSIIGIDVWQYLT